MTSDAVLKAVAHCRRRDHACTVQTLGHELDLSPTATRYWVKKLVGVKMLMDSGVPGGIYQKGS